MSLTPHILVVDDDERLRKLLDRYLSDKGFEVTVAEDAAQALEQMQILVFDALILDVMMPGMKGTDLSEALKSKNPNLPILLLTAMSEPDDRISGLQTGADDYLTKPFEPEELILRLKNIIGRKQPAKHHASTINFGPNRFDLNRQTLTQNDKAVQLSTAEARLLKTLAEKNSEPISRQDLQDMCEISGNLRTVDVQITRLRKKIETDAKHPRYLQTVRGKGYVLYLD